MANHLTGDYEAVVQIAVRQINGLLATLHQNGTAEDAPLKLLHSVSTRVGDPRRRPPDVAVFGDWVLEYQKARSRGRMDSLRAELVGMAPPGASSRPSVAGLAWRSNFSTSGGSVSSPHWIRRSTSSGRKGCRR